MILICLRCAFPYLMIVCLGMMCAWMFPSLFSGLADSSGINSSENAVSADAGIVFGAAKTAQQVSGRGRDPTVVPSRDEALLRTVEPQYSVVQIGPAEALQSPQFNNRGQFVANRMDEDGTQRAVYRWRIDDPGTQFDLPSFDPSSRTSVSGLNNQGQAVGAESIWNEQTEDVQSTIAVMWDPLRGNLVELPAPGAQDACARGINDHGHVFGWVRYRDDTRLRNVLWTMESTDDGKPVYAPPLDLDALIPEEAIRPVVDGISGMQDEILVLGVSVRRPCTGGETLHDMLPCVWTVQRLGNGGVDVRFAFLPHAEITSYVFQGSNSRGDFLFRTSDAGYLWVNEGGYGEPIDFGNLGLSHRQDQRDRVYPSDLNIMGQVVGSIQCQTNVTWETSAFIWQAGEMFNLNEMLPGGQRFMNAPGLQINDWGQILGPMEDGNWCLAIPKSVKRSE